VHVARARVNLARLRYLAGALIPLHAAHVVFFARSPDAGLTTTRLLWRALLLDAHLALLVAMTALAALSLGAWRRPADPPRWRAAVPVLAAFTYLQAGAWISAIDQLVTVAVTPYVIASLAVAFAFRFSARTAMAAHLTALVAYVIGVLLFQPDADARLSSILNGIAVTGVALALALSLTRYFDGAERARRTIERQHTELSQLRGLLRICSYCKKIRNEDDAWETFESYIGRHTELQLSHGLCDSCLDQHFGHLRDEDET